VTPFFLGAVYIDLLANVFSKQSRLGGIWKSVSETPMVRRSALYEENQFD
jgi:hypothetical protein